MTTGLLWPRGYKIASSPGYDATVLADGPLGYWKLDETSGTSMADSSGNTRNGTYSGATLNQAALLPYGSTASALGGSSGQGIGNIASAAWMNVDNFSAECWVKPANSNDVRGIFSRVGGSSGWWVIWQRSNTIGCTAAGGDGAQKDISGAALVVGNVYHVVQTVSGTTESLYINGTLFATNTFGSANSGATAGNVPIEIGGYSGGNFAQAYVDNCAFYGAALSATRIAAHYAAATVPAFSSGQFYPRGK